MLSRYTVSVFVSFSMKSKKKNFKNGSLEFVMVLKIFV